MNSDDNAQNGSGPVSRRIDPHPMAITDSPEDYADSNGPSLTEEYSELMEGNEQRPPPLLLPPPRSQFGELRHNTSVAVVQLLRMLGFEHDVFNHLLRLVFFLTKLATLAQPCWPYATRLEVGLPLIIIASLDLRAPMSMNSSLARRNERGEIEFGPSRVRGMGWSLALLVLHAAVLWIAGRWNRLCVSPPRDVWADW